LIALLAQGDNGRSVPKRNRISRCLTIPIAVIAICGALIARIAEAVAQSPADPWAAPVNLSQSGAAAEPRMVVDSTGRFHILWLDAFDGFAYTTGDGTRWSPPAFVETPFGPRRWFPDLEDEDPTPPLYLPRLAADTDGRIHPFWAGEDGILFSSNVPAVPMSP